MVLTLSALLVAILGQMLIDSADPIKDYRLVHVEYARTLQLAKMVDREYAARVQDAFASRRRQPLAHSAALEGVDALLTQDEGGRP